MLWKRRLANTLVVLSIPPCLGCSDSGTQGPGFSVRDSAGVAIAVNSEPSREDVPIGAWILSPNS